jgi:hypothetical protein
LLPERRVSCSQRRFERRATYSWFTALAKVLSFNAQLSEFLCDSIALSPQHMSAIHWQNAKGFFFTQILIGKLFSPNPDFLFSYLSFIVFWKEI